MSTYDSRFDEAEAEVDRGEPWKPKEEGAPNPLTILAEEWVSISTDYGDTELLVGRDRDGKRWSVLAGKAILKKLLIDGVVEEFDEAQNAFVQKEVLGKVEPGEVVSIKFLGERQGGTFTYDNFAVSRKPARDVQDLSEEPNPGSTEAPAGSPESDDVPF